jgi:hypothetical protein
VRQARRKGFDGVQPEGLDDDIDEIEESEGIAGISAKVAAAAARLELAPTRIPRISVARRKAFGKANTVSGADSAEDLLMEYVSPPPTQEAILEPALALRLLYALLSKILPELKGNPNILKPARAVMDDEKSRYSDLRARFNEQGLAA